MTTLLIVGSAALLVGLCIGGLIAQRAISNQDTVRANMRRSHDITRRKLELAEAELAAEQESHVHTVHEMSDDLDRSYEDHAHSMGSIKGLLPVGVPGGVELTNIAPTQSGMYVMPAGIVANMQISGSNVAVGDVLFYANAYTMKTELA